MPETVYKARVDRPVPGAGAVFVNLGEAGQGYLRDAKGVKPGAVMLVEASSIPEPGKAVPVSPRVLHRQRYSIHTPGAKGINVARGIADAAERTRLTGIVEKHIASLEDWLARMGDVRDPDDVARVRRMIGAHRTGGAILRTAAEGQTAERIVADLDLAVAARLDAEDALADPATPLRHRAGCTAAARPCTARMGRPDRPRRDRRRRFRHAGDARASSPISACRPNSSECARTRWTRWESGTRSSGCARRASTCPPAAGSRSSSTRAMVTVDVNTGAEFSSGAGITANIEAARELPRQLRLRGLGGQVAIDLAPLKKTERKRVEDTLKSAFRRDPVETTLAGWTPLGHFELQRKRERRPLSECWPGSTESARRACAEAHAPVRAVGAGDFRCRRTCRSYTRTNKGLTRNSRAMTVPAKTGPSARSAANRAVREMDRPRNGPPAERSESIRPDRTTVRTQERPDRAPHRSFISPETPAYAAGSASWSSTSRVGRRTGTGRSRKAGTWSPHANDAVAATLVAAATVRLVARLALAGLRATLPVAAAARALTHGPDVALGACNLGRFGRLGGARRLCRRRLDAGRGLALGRGLGLVLGLAPAAARALFGARGVAGLVPLVVPGGVARRGRRVGAGDLGLDHLLDGIEILAVPRHRERDRRAGFSGATRPADAVDIVLGMASARRS